MSTFPAQIAPLLGQIRLSQDPLKILLCGEVTAEMLAAARQRSTSVVIATSPDSCCDSDEQRASVNFRQPWVNPPPSYDVIVANISDRYFNRAFVEYLGQMAPFLLLAPARSGPVDGARILSGLGFIIEQDGQVVSARYPQRRVSARRPLLMHVHVPKTAGTSFNKVLEATFGTAHLNWYLDDPAQHISVPQMTELLYSRPDLVSISSHSFRRFPPTLADRIPLYVCFLRRPMDHLLSNMTFLLKNFDALPIAMRKDLPSNTPRMPIRELLRWCLARRGENNRLGHVTHFLAEPEWEASAGSLCPEGPGTGRIAEALLRCYDEVATDLAQRVLDRFFFVGLTECAAEGIELLNQDLTPYAMQLSAALPHENRSAEVAGDRSWLTADDEVGRQALEYAQIDHPLYSYGTERMNRRRAKTPE